MGDFPSTFFVMSVHIKSRWNEILNSKYLRVMSLQTAQPGCAVQSCHRGTCSPSWIHLRRHNHLSAPSLQHPASPHSWQHLARPNGQNVIPRWYQTINPTYLPYINVCCGHGTSNKHARSRVWPFEIKQVSLLGIWTTSEQIHSCLFSFQV